MSVINKMLRDLDSRRAADTLRDQTRDSRTSMASDTVIVNDSDRTGRRRGSLHLGAVLTLSLTVLVAAAGAWWYLNQTGFFQPKVEQVTLLAPPVMDQPVISVVPEGEPVIVISPPPAIVNSDNPPPKAAIESPPVVAKISPPPALVNSDNPPPKAAIEKPPVVAKLSAAASSPTRSSRSDATGTPRAAPARPMTERPVNKRPVTLAPPTPAAAVPAPQILQRRSPVLEALAQAQSLWNSGSRQAAIDLLREALAAAERANPVGTPSGNHSELASLARELARMDLSEGRAGPALEMLTRLEPALSGFADVWALRGNAAQRLGRHQESVAAYLMALKLRPDEPRWMLGAAVSLAAQGQTVRAAELAEKARAGGVLSPEVATYLRQLGVPLRER